MSALLPNCPQADLQYLAGFFDGDGCVTTQPDWAACRLEVTQQVFGQEVLLAFLRAFGGSLRMVAPGKGCTRPVLQWQVYGQGATMAARLLQQHCIVKKKQLKIAATWPSSTFERLRCSSRLAELKRLPISPSGNANLSWSYVAGFFDAEGCINVSSSSKSVWLDLSQKDPAVLLSIKAFLQFETASSQVSGPTGLGCKYIRVTGKIGVTHILQQLLVHGLLGKRVTTSNVLTSMLAGASHTELRKSGFSNKGNQNR